MRKAIEYKSNNSILLEQEFFLNNKTNYLERKYSLRKIEISWYIFKLLKSCLNNKITFLLTKASIFEKEETDTKIL